MDFDKQTSPDEIVDLNKKWPWKDNLISHLYTSHTIEHLDSILHIIQEFHRVCVENTEIEIKVPYFSGLTAFSDPTHKLFFFKDF